MGFGDFAVLRPTPKTALGPEGLTVTYPADFPAFEWNANGTFRGVNTGDTDIWRDDSTKIGQTEGTIIFTVNLALSSINAPILSFIGTGGNSIIFSRTSDNRIVYTVTAGGVVQTSIQTGTGQSGTLDVRAAYATDDFVLYVNKAQIGTDSSGTVPATSIIGVGINALQTQTFGEIDETFGAYDVAFGGENMTDAFFKLVTFTTRKTNAQILAYT
jgi:hypothetical protein